MFFFVVLKFKFELVAFVSFFRLASVLFFDVLQVMPTVSKVEFILQILSQMKKLFMDPVFSSLVNFIKIGSIISCP